MRFFLCGELGHISTRCPARPNLYCMSKSRAQGLVRDGNVEGVEVNCICIDRGCSQSLVQRNLVPRVNILSERTETRCVYVDVVPYPLAIVKVVVDGRDIVIKAGLVEKLPIDVLLGTDIPDLIKLIHSDTEEKECLVLTRAQDSREEANETKDLEANESAEVTLTGIETDGESVFEFEDELYGESRVRKRLSRSEKRKNRWERLEAKERQVLEMNGEELREAQELDEMLRGVREALKAKGDVVEGECYQKDGKMYRKGMKGGRRESVEQLVLPGKCREMVMGIGHSIPLAGHLRRRKTLKRVLQRFWWPRNSKDVGEFCQACSKCPMTSSRKVCPVPLIPLPGWRFPFRELEWIW